MPRQADEVYDAACWADYRHCFFVARLSVLRPEVRARNDARGSILGCKLVKGDYGRSTKRWTGAREVAVSIVMMERLCRLGRVDLDAVENRDLVARGKEEVVKREDLREDAVLVERSAPTILSTTDPE